MEKQHKSKLPALSMKSLIIAIALLLVFFAAGARFGVFLAGNDQVSLAEEAEQAFIKVDIKGAVINPGVYQLPESSRVEDALALANPSADADLSMLNLAAFIIDGSELIVSSQTGAAVDWNALAQQRSPVYYGSTTDSSGVSTVAGKININTAGSEALQTLPGIGPAKAEQIIAHREQNGPFATIEQIMNVSGIGSATFDKFKEIISVE